MRNPILVMALWGLMGCKGRCPSKLDGPDSITVEVDTSGAAPKFTWDGGEVAMLDVWLGTDPDAIDTGMGSIDAKSDSELLWRLECGYVTFGKRAAIRHNCIASPVTWADVPDGVDESFRPSGYEEGDYLEVVVHRYPEVDGESCYAHDDGTTDFEG